MINFFISKSDIAKFRRWAKKAWPNEIICAMIGKRSEIGEWYVMYLSDPVTGTPTEVEFDSEDWRDVVDEADNCQIIGTIHTHPAPMVAKYVPAEPSKVDLESAAKDREKMFGICSVWKGSDGKMKTHLQFYAGGPEISVKMV